jgi:hypothetical protein
MHRVHPQLLRWFPTEVAIRHINSWAQELDAASRTSHRAECALYCGYPQQSPGNSINRYPAFDLAGMRALTWQGFPWLLEDRLRERGGLFRAGPPWQSHVVADGNLITGQNPASSRAATERTLDALGVRT